MVRFLKLLENPLYICLVMFKDLNYNCSFVVVFWFSCSFAHLCFSKILQDLNKYKIFLNVKFV